MEKCSVLIRRAVKADAESLAKLYTELEKDAVHYQPEHFVMSDGSSRLNNSMFEDDAQALFVAEENGDIVGFVHIVLLKAKDIPCLRPQRNIYIQDMVVTKAYRSKGVGSRLMSAVKEYAKANGAEFLRTQVFPQNEDGMRFYEKNGFSLKMLTIECPL